MIRAIRGGRARGPAVTTGALTTAASTAGASAAGAEPLPATGLPATGTGAVCAPSSAPHLAGGLARRDVAVTRRSPRSAPTPSPSAGGPGPTRIAFAAGAVTGAALVLAPPAPAADYSTFRAGNWFHQAGDPQDTNIWTPPPPPDRPGPGDTANVAHNATLQNTAGDTWTDGQTTLELSNLNLSAGYVNVETTYTLNVEGFTNWTGGEIRGGGFTVNRGRFGQRGVMTVGGAGTPTLNDGLIENTDRIALAGDLVMNDDSVLLNLSGVAPDPSVAVVDFTTDADIVNGATADNRFHNAGVVRKTGGTGDSRIDVTFNHLGGPQGPGGNQAGTIEVQTGTLTLAGGAGGNAGNFAPVDDNTGGFFNVAAGASLVFGGTAHHRLGGDADESTVPVYSGAGGGSVRLVDGATINGNRLGLSGTGDAPRMALDFPAGLFQWEGGRLINGPIRNDGFIQLVGPGTKTITGSLVNTDTVRHQGDGPLLLDGLTAVVNEPGGLYDLQGDGDVAVDPAQGGADRFVNRGTLRKSAGTGVSRVDIAVDQTGAVEVLSGTMQIDRVLQLSGTALTGGAYRVGPGATLQIDTGSNVTVNQSDVVLSGPGSVFAKIDTLADNRGRFEINGGRNFTTAGALANTGTITVGEGSTLVLNGAYTQTGAGLLRGDGVIQTASVSNGGTVSPGASPGSLGVSGNYTQEAAGTLLVEVGGTTPGTQHDVLAVTGAADLDGTLDVDLLPGAVFPQGQQFVILTAGSVTGTFAAFDNPTFSGQPVFQVHYGPTDVRLEALLAVPEPGGLTVLALAAGLVGRRRRR